MTPQTYFMALYALGSPVYLGNMRTNACLKFLDSNIVCYSEFIRLMPVWVRPEFKKGYRDGATDPN